MPEFFEAVGATRFGVMAGAAAVLTAFFLHTGGAINKPKTVVVNINPARVAGSTGTVTPQQCLAALTVLAGVILGLGGTRTASGRPQDGSDVSRGPGRCRAGRAVRSPG